MYTSNIIVKQENTNGSSNLSVMFALCKSLEILLTYKDITFMMLHLRLYGVLGFHYGSIYNSEIKNVSGGLTWHTRLQPGRGEFNNCAMLSTEHGFIRMNVWVKSRGRIFWRCLFLKDSDEPLIHLHYFTEKFPVFKNNNNKRRWKTIGFTFWIGFYP